VPPGADKEDPMSDMFAEEFSDEMAKQFQERMKNLMGEDPKLVEKIEKLAEAAGISGYFRITMMKISDLIHLKSLTV
jgi:hypothetical protein